MTLNSSSLVPSISSSNTLASRGTMGISVFLEHSKSASLFVAELALNAGATTTVVPPSPLASTL
ncbi:hypothetical protein ACHAWC_006526 [Mediolabrus comicus]